MGPAPRLRFVCAAATRAAAFVCQLSAWARWSIDAGDSWVGARAGHHWPLGDGGRLLLLGVLLLQSLGSSSSAMLSRLQGFLVCTDPAKIGARRRALSLLPDFWGMQLLASVLLAARSS